MLKAFQVNASDVGSERSLDDQSIELIPVPSYNTWDSQSTVTVDPSGLYRRLLFQSIDCVAIVSYNICEDQLALNMPDDPWNNCWLSQSITVVLSESLDILFPHSTLLTLLLSIKYRF